jgi:hypothetical protein
MEKIVGTLVHACTILPTSKALLTPLYQSITNHPTVIGLGKLSEVRAAFLDIKAMVCLLALRPTHVYELVDRPPTFVGMVDTSSMGVGGKWFIPNWPPLVYRYQWPAAIHHPPPLP